MFQVPWPSTGVNAPAGSLVVRMVDPEVGRDTAQEEMSSRRRSYRIARVLPAVSVSPRINVGSLASTAGNDASLRQQAVLSQVRFHCVGYLRLEFPLQPGALAVIRRHRLKRLVDHGRCKAIEIGCGSLGMQ